MKKRNSFFIRILITLVLATFLEGIFFVGSLNVSRSFETIEEETISLFEQRIQYRSSYIHKALIETLIKESNYNDLLKDCSELYENKESLAGKDTILTDKEVNDLLLLLHSRTISGAFVILDKDVFKTAAYPAIYLRDSSPDTIHNDNSDISARYGDATILKNNNLSLDANWHAAMAFSSNSTMYRFYTEPFGEALLHPGQEALEYGYWGNPIQFEGEARELITFSFPLIDENGVPYGVIGIDITADMLKDMLDYTELSDHQQTAYILAKKNDEGTYTVMYCNGPAYSYIAKQGNKITLEESYMYDTHELHLNPSTQLASSFNLDFYPSNSPFEDMDWYLIGVADKGELLESSMTLKKNAYFAIFLSMFIGISAAILISIKFIRPIKKLIAHLKHANVNEKVELPRVNIEEIDELSSSIEELSHHLLSAENRMSQIIHATEFPVGAIESFGKDTYYVTERVAELLDFPDELHHKTIIPKTTFTSALDAFELHAELVEEHKEELDEKTIHTYVYRHEKTDGEKRWVRFTYSMQKESRVFIVMDVTKEFEEKERLTYERDHDALTGLLNRNAFQEKVEEILKEDIGIAAMVLWDLDNLKFTNDTYGHNVGDLLIKTSAAILGEAKSSHCITARMAGDEFLIFFHHYENRDDLFLDIQKIHLKIINTKIKLSDTDTSVIKVSAGIAWYPDDAKDYETLLKYSDFAMYDVKNSQKGSIHSFDAHMYKHNELLFSGRKELNEMLECRQIRYAYQPIISASDGSVLGFEALMRPQGKILTSPQDVLRLARAQAQLYRVEYITWTTAMQTFMKLNPSATYGGCKLFINSIPSMPLLDDLISTLEENYATLLPNVVVELLETDEIEHTYLKLKQNFIKKWNGGFAIDDYGSGHNSDTALLNVEADYIKIDIELIKNIDKDPDRKLMVSNIIALAHQRNIMVIAEGIERREELETLLSMQVDYLQGYYLARPSYELHDIGKDVKDIIQSYSKKS